MKRLAFAGILSLKIFEVMVSRNLNVWECFVLKILFISLSKWYITVNYNINISVSSYSVSGTTAFNPSMSLSIGLFCNYSRISSNRHAVDKFETVSCRYGTCIFFKVRTSENHMEFLFIRTRTRKSEITNNIDKVTPHGSGIFQNFLILF